MSKIVTVLYKLPQNLKFIFNIYEQVTTNL